MQVDIQINLLTEVKKVLCQTGIRSIINYLWFVLKYLGMHPPTLRLNTKRYSDSKILRDVPLLKQIRKYLGFTIDIYPRESYKFHNKQKFTFLSYFWNSRFAKDPTRMNQQYVSLTTKKDALFRYKKYGSKIIMDKAEESNIFKPSFFVLKEDDTIVISIRGTANSNDKLVDINIKAIMLDEYLVHSGFYQHAEYIYRQLDEAQIFSNQYQYITTGYSMGGSISCLLAYLIYTKVTKNVHSYGFGSGPVGNFLFAQFTQQFTTTVISGYDFVPHMTMHGLYCQCQRLLYENNLRVYKSHKKDLSQEVKQNKSLVSNFEMKIQKYDQSLNDGVLDLSKMQIYELFDKIPMPAELSLMSVTHLDMFVGGVLYHCIKGNLYKIDIHDYSEFYPSQIGFIDHYTYPWMYKYLATVIQKYEEQNQNNSILSNSKIKMRKYAQPKLPQ